MAQIDAEKRYTAAQTAAEKRHFTAQTAAEQHATAAQKAVEKLYSEELLAKDCQAADLKEQLQRLIISQSSLKAELAASAAQLRDESVARAALTAECETLRACQRNAKADHMCQTCLTACQTGQTAQADPVCQTDSHGVRSAREGHAKLRGGHASAECRARGSRGSPGGDASSGSAEHGRAHVEPGRTQKELPVQDEIALQKVTS